jgi:uncharacterized membrane protein YidH (DUF202 family)
MSAQYRAADSKAFFASERTFLHWLSVAVTFGSIAAGILGVSSAGHKRWGPDHGWLAIGSRLVGLAILAFSIALVIAASYSFYIRKERLRTLSDGGYDSKIIPLTVAITMTIVLGAAWIGAIIQYAKG